MSEIVESEQKISISMLDKIMYLEELLLKMDQAEIPTIHRFADGLYCREINCPKGTLLTGEIHKKECFLMITKGSLTIIDMKEGSPKHIVAPFFYVSKPGTKRAAYCHEEVTWLTIHPTNEKDIEKVEDEIFDRSYKLSDDVRSILEKTPSLMDDLVKVKEGQLWLE